MSCPAEKENLDLSGLAEPIELQAAVFAAVGRIDWSQVPEATSRTVRTLQAITDHAIEAGFLSLRIFELEGRSLQVVDNATFVADLAHAIERLRAEPTRAGSLRATAPQPSRSRRLGSMWEHVGQSPRLARWLRSRGVLNDDRLLRVLIRRGLDPYQRRPEIKAFAGLVRAKRARSMLEIGTANAGTFAYLANVMPGGSTLVTLDVQRPPGADVAVALAPKGSRVLVETGDSHDRAIIDSVHARWPEGFDLVFIDGDHSYDGVRADTLAFADLVKPGGLLAFHDIVPSSFDRFGVRTLAEVGGVPTWWRQIREHLPPSFTTHELVADWNQDGMGIGVVEFPVAGFADLARAIRATLTEATVVNSPTDGSPDSSA